MPTVLFLSYLLILIKPPNIFVTIAKYNVIKVTILPYTFKDSLKLFTEYGSNCFLGTKRFPATSLFSSVCQTASRMMTSLIDDVTIPSLSGLCGSLDSALQFVDSWILTVNSFLSFLNSKGFNMWIYMYLSLLEEFSQEYCFLPVLTGLGDMRGDVTGVGKPSEDLQDTLANVGDL